jgi:hypothetical protein
MATTNNTTVTTALDNHDATTMAELRDLIGHALNHEFHGSGFNCAAEVDADHIAGNIIVTTGYHSMDDNGMYNGWVNITLDIVPSAWQDFQLTITNDSMDDDEFSEATFDEYFGDHFYYALESAFSKFQRGQTIR